MWAQISYLNVSKKDEGGRREAFSTCPLVGVPLHRLKRDGWVEILLLYYTLRCSQIFKCLQNGEGGGVGSFPHVSSRGIASQIEQRLVPDGWVVKILLQMNNFKPCGFNCCGSTIVNLPLMKNITSCGINSGSHRTPLLSENS